MTDPVKSSLSAKLNSMEHKDAGGWLTVLLRLAVVFSLVCVLVVFLVGQIEERMAPPAAAKITEFKAATAYPEVMPDSALPDDVFVQLPTLDYAYTLGQPGRFVVLRTHIDLSAQSHEELALYMRRVRERVAITVNGFPVGLEAIGEADLALNSFEPRYYRLHPDHLVDGRNEIDIYIYSETSEQRFYGIYIGNQQDLANAFRWRHFLATDMYSIINGIGVFMALFALGVGVATVSQRKEYLAFSLAIILMVGRNLYYSAPMNDWPVFVQNILFVLTTFGLVLSCAVFVNAWTKGRKADYLNIGFVFVSYLLIACVAQLLGAHIFRMLYLFVGLPVILLTMIWIGYRLIMAGKLSIPVMIAFSACVAASLVDMMSAIQMINNVAWPSLVTSIPYTPIATLVVALGLIYSLSQQTVKLQQAERQQSEVLAQELAIRKRELQASYARTREQERLAAINEERQRIMQDMHDGIGSELLSLQLRIKHEALSSEELAEALRTSLSDLRLIVDSLDTETDDIALALGAFRARIQPQLSAAGVELVWQMEIDEQVSGFGPKSVLHIYRIMQEAVTNALRHAQMSVLKIHMSCETGPGNGMLVICVEDNGRGIAEDQIISRRGLRNIKRRAHALNAEVSVQNTGMGTAVMLRVPLR